MVTRSLRMIGIVASVGYDWCPCCKLHCGEHRALCPFDGRVAEYIGLDGWLEYLRSDRIFIRIPKASRVETTISGDPPDALSDLPESGPWLF